MPKILLCFKNIIITFLLWCVSLSAFTQISYDYPYAQDSINLIKGAPDKALPFDKPFSLIINPAAYKFDISQITKVYAYKIKHNSGKRELKYSKPDIVFSLVNSYQVVGGKIVINQQGTYDTSGGKLVLYFPGLKPNEDFDISIHQLLNVNQRFELLSIINAFHLGKAKEAGKLFNKINTELTVSNSFTNSRSSFNYKDSADYNNKKNGLIMPIIQSINSTNFLSFSIGTTTQIKNAFGAADAIKYQSDILYLLYPKDVSAGDIEKGLLALSISSQEKAEDLDVITRLKNITSTLKTLVQIRTALWQLYLKTQNSDVQALLVITDQNIANLLTNQTTLKGLSDAVVSATDDMGTNGQPATYQAVWVIGSNKNYNLTTRGGSVLSTEIGITNLRLRNNSNKIQNIQKLYTGINIFFRSVDRNLSTNQMRTTSPNDHLSSRKTLFQHLTLSLGLTFGDYDQSDVNKKDFQNLLSGMSLMVGPSYRFCRAFRLAAGAVILKRTNPNPLISGTVPTVGLYSSFSIDFDFVSTISNVTARILK